MAWIYLTVAAIFEVGWPLGFKLADLHPHRFGTFISLAAVSMVLSGIFLYLAQRTIPVSTAYIVWTGIGAVAIVKPDQVEKACTAGPGGTPIGTIRQGQGIHVSVRK